VIEAIAEILRACPDLRLRIAGYTDAQGREDSNLELSQARAEAVLAALRSERVPVAGFEAQGYGEASPIDSNETEAGREANRRIEFTLLGATATASAGATAAEPSGAGDLPVAQLTVSEPSMAKPDSPPLRPREIEEEATAFLEGRGEAEPAAASEAGAGPAEDAGEPAAEEDGPLAPEDAMAAIGAPEEPAAAGNGAQAAGEAPEGEVETSASGAAAAQAEGAGPATAGAPAAGPAVADNAAPDERDAGGVADEPGGVAPAAGTAEVSAGEASSEGAAPAEGEAGGADGGEDDAAE
jgi:OOP family OmpA-OmpF porin